MAMAAAVAAAAVGDGGNVLAHRRFRDRWTPATPGFADHLSRLSVTQPGRRSVTKVVAIDGPAGAGKSTLAQAVADHLGLERLDTGAMYRAVAWGPWPTDRARRQRGRGPVWPGDSASRGPPGHGGRDRCDRRHPHRRGRPLVSAVAANPAVRATLVARQRRWVAERGAGVVEGRDIGTVVLPDADLKIYLTAGTGRAGPATGRGTGRRAQRGRDRD